MSRNIYSVLEMKMSSFQSEARMRSHLETYLNPEKIKFILNRDLEASLSSSKVEEELGYK